MVAEVQRAPALPGEVDLTGGQPTRPDDLSLRYLIVAVIQARKADHAAGDSLSISPFGFAESRISTDPSTTATSTQPLVSDAPLFRHEMHGSLKSATRSPSRRVAGPPSALAAVDRHELSDRPTGVQVTLRLHDPRRSKHSHQGAV
jgi:hypothetical protein